MNTISDSIAGFSGDPIGAASIFAAVHPHVDPTFVVERLNSLLRGEISAAETYRNVLERATGTTTDENLGLLQDLQEEHTRNCDKLRGRITELGGDPSNSSGVWGFWAEIVQGTLTLFGGNMGGVRALLEGEQHGLTDYEAALNELDPVSAQLIQNQLLPAQERHIEVLLEILKV